MRPYLAPAAKHGCRPFDVQSELASENAGIPVTGQQFRRATVHHGRGTTYILRPVWTQVRLHKILSPMWHAGNGSSIYLERATTRLLSRLR